MVKQLEYTNILLVKISSRTVDQSLYVRPKNNKLFKSKCFFDFHFKVTIIYRAGSRIFRRGGRGPILGGFGLQRGHFSVKMYAKMKELGPVGGVRRHGPLDPPMIY